MKALRTCCLAVCLGLALVAARAGAGELDTWSAWDGLLAEAVDGGSINYTMMQRRRAFHQTVRNISFADTNLLVTRESQLAFYINAYNVLAVQAILDGHSPITLWGRHRYFKTATYTVSGKQVNLHDLEHGIIRPYGEPRIHFALACGAKGCPPLRDEAYTADQLSLQLEDATTRFVNDPHYVQVDREAGLVRLSQLFQWYQADFEAGGGVLPFVADHIEDPALAEELRTGNFRIEYIEFDWRPNGTFPVMP